MRAILIIGWKTPSSAPEGLYCGIDGVKAAEIANKARESGKYHALRRIGEVQTVGHPLPTVPTKPAEPQPSEKAPEVKTKPSTKDTENENA